MAKSNQQNKLLKKYSKGGFSKNEKKKLSQKLGIKQKQANSLTKSYSKQLKTGSKSNKSKPNKSKPSNSKSSNSKSNKSGFGIKSTSYAPGVSIGKKPKDTKPKSKFGVDTTKKAPYVNTKPTGTTKPPKVDPKSPKPPKPPKPPTPPKKPRPTPPPPKTPRPTPPPSRPVDPNDIEDIISRIINDRSDQPAQPDLTVDPRIGNLEGQLQDATTDLTNLQDTYNQSNENYLTQIGGLRDQIGGYEDQIGQYQTDISDLSTQLLENARKAKQFKQMDTQYLTNNNASGIRLRRSKRFKSGDFALGASGLNRKNRAPFKISNVNL
jgi:hypothetical protein